MVSAGPRVLYIGAPEARASDFERRATADVPGLDLLAVDDRREALRCAPGAQAMIGHHFQFDDELLRAAPRLRWIQSLTTGTDAILKLPSLRPEVLVTSTRGMHGPQMSELVFLQMLALTRDYPRVLADQHNERWDRRPQPLLWGKTVVIVGVGAISEALALRCKAFGMTVHGVSATDRAVPGFDAIVPRADLASAVAAGDYVVLVVPLARETENLVDATVLAAMKPTAFLINVARGGVLDEGALVAALRERRLAGAALDVFREQPLPPGHVLWREPGVLVTPLVGGMSDVYLEQAYPIVIGNLRKWLKGEEQHMSNIVPH